MNMKRMQVIALLGSPPCVWISKIKARRAPYGARLAWSIGPKKPDRYFTVCFKTADADALKSALPA
jgi:hypothetical protein